MIKVSYFPGVGEHGPNVIPLFRSSTDAVFEKVASPQLMPEVVKYIEKLKPLNDSQYILVNAMGASEYYGSNINGDHFPEESLIHRPDVWSGDPMLDKIRSRDWPYGFPTFYNAQVFAHHRNKDASRGFGGVELALWNPGMRRVELVTRLDRDRCLLFNGLSVWDKLQADEFPDVSMGTKVPFDCCSICTDWELFHKAAKTFNPAKHKHVGLAILEFHKSKKAKDGVGIRGVSVTRKDYCVHAKTQMNRIYPDGRKVWVFNHFPRFFDISYVFIGADKIAKAMAKLAAAGRSYFDFGGLSADVAARMGYEDDSQEKTASVVDELEAYLTDARAKTAKQKRSEITKQVPSQFAKKVVPDLTEKEPDLPDSTLKLLGSRPLEEALSTTGGLGMVLRPREFQKVVLIRLGKSDLADKLDRDGKVFPKVDEEEKLDMGASSFSSTLARMLMPLMDMRSALGPLVERRVVIVVSKPPEKEKKASSHPTELLRKIGAAYNGYRKGLMDLIASSQPLLEKVAAKNDTELLKIADAQPEELITPLSYAYLTDAYMDEVGGTASEVVKVKY
jgi:hypothetical protein